MDFFLKFRSNILFSAQYSGNEVTITNLLTFFENPCTVNREEKSELDNWFLSGMTLVKRMCQSYDNTLSNIGVDLENKWT